MTSLVLTDAPPGPIAPEPQKTLVLLVDDQMLIGKAVQRLLLPHGDIEFHFCSDCTRALDVARRVRPTVILQDLVMPEVSGLDLVRAYRADPLTQHIPIIVLSAKEEGQVKSEAFQAGANDYLVKLPDAIELLARIRYHSNAYLAQIQRDEAYRALRRSQQELMEMNIELQRMAEVDAITGLNNRRHMNEYLSSQWQHAAQVQSQISLLMVDIDHFKRFNDFYGHLAGDEVLQQVAQAIKTGCRRSTDVAGRFGGEEFVVVLPATRNADARTIADLVVAAVEGLQIPHEASTTSRFVTVSVGGATVTPTDDTSFNTLVEIADRALYRAKHRGRNRAVVD